MANNIIDISLANPIRFVPVGGTSKQFDDDWFINLLHDWEDQVDYMQPWEKTDTIKLQFWANFTPISVAIRSCDGQTVSTFNATEKTSQVTDPDFKPYEVSVSLAGLDTGRYYLVLTAGTVANQTQMISEPLWVDDTIPDSILFTYSNSINSQGVIWDTGVQFAFRAPGVIKDLLPGFQDTIYQDQVLNNVLLNSIPFRQFKLYIGGQNGVPDWIVDRVNRILACDTWDADGKAFVKKDGTQWTPVTLENYPLSGWSIDILEGSNMSSTRGTNQGDARQQIVVTYNIETKLFGTFNDLPDNNTVQITEID